MVSIYNIVSFNWSINYYTYFKTPIYSIREKLRRIQWVVVVSKKQNIWSFKYNCISFIIIIIIIIITVKGVYEINPIRTAELRSN